MNSCVIFLAFSVLIATLNVSAHGADCGSPEAVAPIDALISRTGRIVLAVADPIDTPSVQDDIPARSLDRDEAIRRATEGTASDRAMPDLQLRKLRVIETLKGAVTDDVFIATNERSGPNVGTDFDGHTDDVFWSDEQTGRWSFDDACERPMTVEEDQTYLLFLGTFHVKQAEWIRHEDDDWLAYVREALTD